MIYMEPIHQEGLHGYSRMTRKAHGGYICNIFFASRILWLLIGGNRNHVPRNSLLPRISDKPLYIFGILLLLFQIFPYQTLKLYSVCKILIFVVSYSQSWVLSKECIPTIGGWVGTGWSGICSPHSLIEYMDVKYMIA